MKIVGESVLTIMLLLLAAGVIYLGKLHYTDHLFWYKRAPRRWSEPEVVLERKPCKACGGVGVVWLHKGKLRIIPKDVRSRQKDWGTHPPLANAQTCFPCKGAGFTWVGKLEEAS